MFKYKGIHASIRNVGSSPIKALAIAGEDEPQGKLRDALSISAAVVREPQGSTTEKQTAMRSSHECAIYCR